MTAYTQEQLALRTFIQAENTAAMEKGSCFLTTDCLDHWAGYGIRSIEEYELYSLKSEYVDTYKEITGIKPSWLDLSGASKEELLLMVESNYEQMREDHEDYLERMKEEEALRVERVNANSYKPNLAFGGLASMMG